MSGIIVPLTCLINDLLLHLILGIIVRLHVDDAMLLLLHLETFTEYHLTVIVLLLEIGLFGIIYLWI